MVKCTHGNGRKPYSMTALEHKILKGHWASDDHMLFVDTAERCYEAGWLDRAGNLTEHGRLAVSLYETFRSEWSDEDWNDDHVNDDGIPWEGDSLLYLNSARMSEVAAPATQNTNVVNTPVAANDEKVVPIGARNPSYMAAPETVECCG